MYSYEDRMKAVMLYIEYDRSAADTIRELGYPGRKTLLCYDGIGSTRQRANCTGHAEGDTRGHPSIPLSRRRLLWITTYIMGVTSVER